MSELLILVMLLKSQKIRAALISRRSLRAQRGALVLVTCPYMGVALPFRAGGVYQ